MPRANKQPANKQPAYIPPAYKDVTVKGTKGKVYATGVDKLGRKQVIYNKWFVDRQRTARFAKVTRLRSVFEKVVKDVDIYLKQRSAKLLSPELSKRTHIAVILRLMIVCNFRIGSMKYLKKYNTHGLTTLMWKHIKFHTSNFKITFVGKKGVINHAVCKEPRLHKLLLKMSKRAEPSSFVFSVSAKDVNEFIKQYSKNATTKDIRTWRANVLFIRFFESAPKEMSVKKKQQHALQQVAMYLHNTPAVCKANYIDPKLLVS